VNRSGVALRTYVVCSVVGIAAYFLLPQSAQNLALIASNMAALTAIVWSWRIRRLRPTSGWLLLASFPAATGLGNVVYFVNDSILHVEPFPSLGDAAFLGGYVLLAAGLLRLQYARSTDRDPSGVLDTAIITVGFAAASWVYFMAPLLHEASSLIERLAALGYPVGDVLVLAVTARFLFTARRRSPIFGWLAGTVVVMLVADTGFAALNLLNAYDRRVDLGVQPRMGHGCAASRRGRLDDSPIDRSQPAEPVALGRPHGSITHPRDRLVAPGGKRQLARCPGHRCRRSAAIRLGDGPDDRVVACSPDRSHRTQRA
jgi:hypothetical protein